MGLDSLSLGTVAIVTGGSSQTAREVAHGLSTWAWRVVLVYLEYQARVEALVAEIIAAGGVAVAVRADLEDDLDVQRLFNESTASFGNVDVIAHTTAEDATVLYGHATGNVRRGGVCVSTTAAEAVDPSVATDLRERGITVERVSPREVLDFLSRWRRETAG
jgi:NAD(P)-dependent dehydrogenase (short-subunit alcohol dehydrogenase family)